MPKATITTKDGAKVVIEGSAQEVQELLGRFHAPVKQAKSAPTARAGVKSKKTLPSMTDGILELKQEGFFKKPKGLAEIKEQLASMGMIYEVTSISGTVLALVKNRSLGRIKEDGRWCYVAR
ncbi:MAG TPA: hypothetical protein VGT03_15495 [Candidatus Acidoferrales bacterium]|nr:hypothetical protein [Candidatus Acidoferrales bacterium]